MAHPSFRVWELQGLGPVRNPLWEGGPEASSFTRWRTMENRALVDSKDGLTEAEFLGAVGCALDPLELLEFQRLVESL